MQTQTETIDGGNLPKRKRRRKGHKTARQTKSTAGDYKARNEIAKKAPMGKKMGAIAERRDQAEMAKKDKKAATDTEAKEVLKTLKPVAEEINAKFKLAQKYEGKAGDHRLSAALLLESARRRCKEAKVSFAKWCEEHVEQSYEEVRKLVAIASAPEPAKALADMRAGAAARNRQMRKRQKVSRDATAPAAKAESAWEAADALVESLTDKEALSLIEARAGPLGMAVVSETQKNILTKLLQGNEEKNWSVNPEELYHMFLGLKASEQLELIKEMANHVGGKFTHEFNADDPDVPASMRRKP